MDWSYSPRSSSMTSLAIPLPPGRRIPRAPRQTATRRRARGQDQCRRRAHSLPGPRRHLPSSVLRPFAPASPFPAKVKTAAAFWRHSQRPPTAPHPHPQSAGEPLLLRSLTCGPPCGNTCPFRIRNREPLESALELKPAFLLMLSSVSHADTLDIEIALTRNFHYRCCTSRSIAAPLQPQH